MKKKPVKRIYLDHAAATPVSEEVMKTMKPYFSRDFGNPGSIHNEGIVPAKALEAVRKETAKVLGARSNEIIFTSGGTEANNLAVLGVANFFKRVSNGKKLHIITTKIEHHSVLKPFKFLENSGFEVTYLNVSKKGIINLDELKKSIKENTVLVSVMYANNEIGTIQPIREIAKIIKDAKKDRVYPIFHTDACQAPGALSLQVSNLGIDLMTLSGAKIYGPKGAGALYIRTGTPIDPIIFGGEQENGMRSGTQDIPAIVGFAKAFTLAEEKKKKESERLTKFRDYFIEKIKKEITWRLSLQVEAQPPSNLKGACELNGDQKLRLPNNVNFYFPKISGEQLVIELDVKGISASTGSACSSRAEAPSHVLLALYGSEERAESSVRFTLGGSTSKSEIDRTVKILKEIIERLRGIKSKV